MKTLLPRIFAVVAALLLSFGFARAAEHFDSTAAISELSTDPADVATNCAPPCIGDDPPAAVN